MFNKFIIFTLLIFLVSCNKDVFEYPNPNFLRYQPEASTAPINDPAIFVGREPVRLSDLKGKDFADKNVQSYFKNMPPDRLYRQRQQANQGVRVPSKSKRVVPKTSNRERLPIKTNNAQDSNYKQVEQYYKDTPYPYQIEQNKKRPFSSVKNKSQRRYDAKGFNKILKKDAIENYPEITAQYPYKDQYKKSKQNDNPYVLDQADREALGLINENYFAPKSGQQNQGYKFRANNMQGIEVIEELDSDILDNMINNDSLNQRFKSRSLPSY